MSTLREAIAPYNPLAHPFYRAWSEGSLTREEIREYAADYYHLVHTFPECLLLLHKRLPPENTREQVLQNYREETEGVPHSKLWLVFAEGMGADPALVQTHTPIHEVAEVIKWLRSVAGENVSSLAALAAFWAYESQVPAIAEEKAKSLRAHYGADEKTCAYFTLHAYVDVLHTETWETLIRDECLTSSDPHIAMGQAIASAETTARLLYRALDGVQARRLAA